MSKKITLVLSAFVLMMGTNIAKASSEKVFDDVRRTSNPIDYRYAEPIVFMERGIEFLVFPNGEFDFNTATNANTRNSTYGAPRGNAYGYYNNHRTSTPVRVLHDAQGKVRRVGNVFINYDAYGRVKRVGSVYMSYNSFALKQVGNLHIIYNRRGRIVNITGFVNYANQNQNNYNSYYTSTQHYPNDYGYINTSSDDDFYYYRIDGTKAKMSDDDIAKIKDEERKTSSKTNRK